MGALSSLMSPDQLGRRVGRKQDAYHRYSKRRSDGRKFVVFNRTIGFKITADSPVSSGGLYSIIGNSSLWTTLFAALLFCLGIGVKP